jgi:hypothetical protein
MYEEQNNKRVGKNRQLLEEQLVLMTENLFTRFFFVSTYANKRFLPQV